MKILIKFPTRNRPDKFKQVFLKYQHMRSKNIDLSFVISMDADDPTMNNDNIKTFLNNQPNVKYFYGNSKTKIQAINADIDSSLDFDILMLASDDMIPTQINYDEIVANDMQTHYPDLDGVLHYNDGRVGERLNTFCILGKKYFDRFGYIYHPSYLSVFCDNEFTDVARSLNKTVYINRQLFFHGWIQFIGVDQLVLRNENQEMYRIDGENYAKRKLTNFAD